MAYPIQIILTRLLAGHLSVPLFLVDPKGNLLFYNEPAEALLGRRFDETGAMPAEEWSSAFAPVDDGGHYPACEPPADGHARQAAAGLPALLHPRTERRAPTH
jgi:PAS domain-containing protein